jgi:hypothetical protein
VSLPQVPFASIGAHEEPTGQIVAGFELLPTPAVKVMNSDGKILPEAGNVVFVSVVETSNQPRTFPPLALSSKVSARSCCRLPECLQLKAKMVIECDCSHPEAGAECLHCSVCPRAHSERCVCPRAMCMS